MLFESPAFTIVSFGLMVLESDWSRDVSKSI